MTTLTRALGKAMLKSLNSYETMYNLVSKSSDADNPLSPKSLPKFRDCLDEKYLCLSCDWKAYKEDTGLIDDEFNKIGDDGVPTVKHNDTWFSNLETAYMELCGKSDEALEKSCNNAEKTSMEESKVEIEQKTKVLQEKKVGELLLLQIEAETESIKADIDMLETEIKSVLKGRLERKKAESLQVKTINLSERMNVGLQALVMQCLPMLEDSESKLKTTLHNQFVSLQRRRLAEMSSQIVEKTEAKVESAASSFEKSSREQTFLKKDRPTEILWRCSSLSRF